MFKYHDPNAPLYHGTISLYSDSIINHGVKLFPRKMGSADFGTGFYLTNHYIQARDWAIRRTNRPIPNKQILDLSGITIGDFLSMKKEFKPMILKFTIKDLCVWKELNYKEFEPNNEWKRFVWSMRQSECQNPLKCYPGLDWVFGPVADGGLLSKNYEDINAYNNKNQLAILSDKAVHNLKLVEVKQC